jgi:hypothetical protein
VFSCVVDGRRYIIAIIGLIVDLDEMMYRAGFLIGVKNNNSFFLSPLNTGPYREFVFAISFHSFLSQFQQNSLGAGHRDSRWEA